ncbi:MAG: phosphoglycerate mutase family protein, partial [Kiloniellales bacterium]|nr:phosphoglycerate mutase family protein [Kiloniellales bacterium]
MILVRHGESHFNKHFNATRRDPGITDPGLTASGKAQAVETAELLANHRPPKRII